MLQLLPAEVEEKSLLLKIPRSLDTGPREPSWIRHEIFLPED